MSETATRAIGPHCGFSHEALFYAGLEGFLAETAPFVRDAVSSGEPVMVALPPVRLDALREVLDGDAAAVRFVDIVELGTNPARIIRPGRASSPATEAGPGPSVGSESRSGPEARRSHPTLVSEGQTRPSDVCRHLDEMAQPSDRPLPDPPTDAVAYPVGEGDLRNVRRLVGQSAARAGLDDRKKEELLLAVHEIASNSVLHAGGWGFLTTWQDGDTVLCEVLDEGRIDQPLVGRQGPDVGATGGRGVWLANQLCDLVQIRTLPAGNAVPLHVRRG